MSVILNTARQRAPGSERLSKDGTFHWAVDGSNTYLPTASSGKATKLEYVHMKPRWDCELLTTGGAKFVSRSCLNVLMLLFCACKATAFSKVKAIGLVKILRSEDTG
jgi:hypothetical protein